jgi:hypothetical protein
MIFRGSVFFAAALMTVLSALLSYASLVEGSRQGSGHFFLPAALLVALTVLCIWFAYALMRNKIIVDNGRITWGYFKKHAVYINDIVVITDVRSFYTLYGEQFVIVRFSDRKNKTYTIAVNSKQGRDLTDSMIETFGKPD